ncbi:hypothetical protein 2 [Shuangao insect virus 9]|uniref:hypothetical protein 2 n=1 Tax=Shuangao insect virus 9 TaxID=1923470 RepID=UPI00090BB7FA|nr:hypothetical protein 2 [Shuangao insect virus 9]APG75749.1 hypothetical protein 2 [Shuangao insect virus 9]
MRMLALEAGDLQADHIRVFVKPEPHKQAKLEEGRLRLISAVSLVDTCVDRILFTWCLEAALDNFLTTPSMIGWTPIYGSWRQLWALYGGSALALDKSAWDWTVQPWLIDAIRDVIKELAIDAPPWWQALVDRRFELLFQSPVFEFQDGTTVKQMGKGIMKSGCYLTIIANTLGQVITHFVACQQTGDNPVLSVPHALGDDTIQRGDRINDIGLYCAALEQLGCKVKGGQVATDVVEFVGFEFREHSCVPAYREKHFYKQEFTPDLGGFLYAMQLLYAHDPAFYAYYRRLAAEKVPSRVTSAIEAKGFMA